MEKLTKEEANVDVVIRTIQRYWVMGGGVAGGMKFPATPPPLLNHFRAPYNLKV
jgi:hypothetical protein